MTIARRQLLKSCALLSAGVFVGTAQGVSKLANEQLQVGFLGVGNHGATNLAAVAKHAQVVALCDVDQTYLAPAAGSYPSAKTFRDLRELLQYEALDAVVISTPDHTHAFSALTALERGLHLFCEKPLTHSVYELHLLLERVAKKKIITQTGMQHHVREGTRRAAAVLKSGMLGEVKEVHAWTDRPIWPQGMEQPSETIAVPKTLAWDLWLGPARERAYSTDYHPLRWRGWHDFGSGALGDFGPHLLAALFCGLELPAPNKVRPLEVKAAGKVAYPKSSTLTFDFSETTSRPALRLFWYDGECQPPPAVTSVSQPPPNGVMVIGERGKLFIPDYGRLPKLLGLKTAVNLPEGLETPDDLHEDWVAACRTGGATCLPFSATSALMQTCLLGNIALRTGSEVSWDEAKRALAPEPATRFLKDHYRDGWQLP